MNEKRTGKCCSINIHEIYFMVHTLNIFYCQTIIQTMEQTQVINLQGLYVHENYICNNFFKTFEQINNNQWIVRQIQKIDLIWFWFLVFNSTFSNISAISWRPVLVVEEAGVPWENLDHGQATGKLYHLRLRVECTLFSSPACELLSPLSVHRPSIRPLTFHILINSSEATWPIWTKLWWNGPLMTPFQNCVWWSRLPTKMAAKLKIAALV